MIAENTQVSPSPERQHWLDKPVLPWWQGLTIEKLLLIIIIVLTVFSRLYDVGARTMAHDEINHVVPAYSFESYVYDPVTHGPFQFHALATAISQAVSPPRCLASAWCFSRFLPGVATWAELARLSPAHSS